MTTEKEFRVTLSDIQHLMMGEGGLDLIPITSDGKQTSMRIVGVTPGGTAARLGAENGDTIESINDMPLSSVGEAYRVADVVRKQGKIVLRGKRGAEPFVTTLLVASME